MHKVGIGHTDAITPMKVIKSSNNVILMFYVCCTNTAFHFETLTFTSVAHKFSKVTSPQD